MTTNKKVYLLREQGSDDFKIGISNNVLSRAGVLPQKIDLKRSFYIESRGPSARAIEFMLHALFQDHRIRKGEGDGSTEWFKGDCYEEVERFLREQPRLKAELKPCKDLLPPPRVRFPAVRLLKPPEPDEAPVPAPKRLADREADDVEEGVFSPLTDLLWPGKGEQQKSNLGKYLATCKELYPFQNDRVADFIAKVRAVSWLGKLCKFEDDHDDHRRGLAGRICLGFHRDAFERVKELWDANLSIVFGYESPLGDIVATAFHPLSAMYFDGKNGCCFLQLASPDTYAALPLFESWNTMLENMVQCSIGPVIKFIQNVQFYRIDMSPIAGAWFDGECSRWIVGRNSFRLLIPATGVREDGTGGHAATIEDVLLFTSQLDWEEHFEPQAGLPKRKGRRRKARSLRAPRR